MTRETRTGGALPPRSGVVLLGHGSRRGTATNLGLRQATETLRRFLGPQIPVAMAGWEFTRPSLEEAVRGLVARGLRTILVMPFFLFDGKHVKEEIPQEIERLRALRRSADLRLLPTLGFDRRLAEVAADRARFALSHLDGRDGSEPYGVALASRGSRRQYDDGTRLRQLATALGSMLGSSASVIPSQAEYERPLVEDACSHLASMGLARVVVVPYIFFPGKVLQDNILAPVELCSKRFPGTRFAVAETLGVEERVVRIAHERILGAMVGVVGTQRTGSEGAD